MPSHSNKARALMKQLGTYIYYKLSQDLTVAQGGQAVSLQLRGAEKHQALQVIRTRLLKVCSSP